jgi:hypothetical protein
VVTTRKGIRRKVTHKRKAPTRPRRKIPIPVEVPVCSLSTLVRATPKEIRIRAGGCSSTQRSVEVFERAPVRSKGNISVMRVTATSKCPHPSGSGRPHMQVIQLFHKPGIVRPDLLPVWVWCSCEHFLFYLEVALEHGKCTSIINSDGAFPAFTNPGMRKYLCKHLVSAATDLVVRKKLLPPDPRAK